MRLVILLLLAALPLQAQDWSASFGSGPFVFGHFAERTVVIGNETDRTTITSRLSAATRAGATADIERDLNRWLALRLDASWTRAPLSIKSSSGTSTVSFDAGRVSVTTFVLPLVVHLNRGAFRIHVLAGPAYALYKIQRRTSQGATVPLFAGTRGRWGGSAGIGAAWWWSRQFALEWQAAAIVTSSPFHVEDIAASSKGVRILRPRNGHTTIGLRYHF